MTTDDPPLDAVTAHVPDAVSIRVLKEQSYDGLHQAVARVHRPHSDVELAGLLRSFAISTEVHRLTVRGGAQSIDTQALGDDVVIQLDCAEMTRISPPQRDDQGDFITLGAAARWGDILAATSQHGLLPHSMVTTSHATVGGTVAAGCISRCSPISGREGTHVRSFKICTLDGQRIECRRADPDPERRELFQAVIGGFGYLGVLTEVTIDLRPPLPGWRPGRRLCVATRVDKQLIGDAPFTPWSAFLPALRERFGNEGPAGLMDRLRDTLEPPPPSEVVAWDAVSSGAWYTPGPMEALLFRSRYVLDRKRDSMPIYGPPPDTPGLMAKGLCNSTLTEIAQELMFAVHRAGVYVDDLTDYVFFMENHVTPMKEAAEREGWRLVAVEQTFVLPAVPTPSDPAGALPAAQFVQLIRPTLCNPLLPTALDPMRPTIIDVLYLPADDFLLSASRGLAGYAVTVSWTGRAGHTWDAMRERLRELSDKCHALGGRVHLIKDVEADQSVLERMYGDAFPRFRALKKRYDPRRLLANEFFDRVFGKDEATSSGSSSLPR